MSEIGDLWVTLRAVTDPFKRGMKEAAAEGEASTTRIGGAFKKLSQIGVVAGGAALAIGAVSVKWAADFQTQMTRLYTAAGLSNQQLKAVHMTSQQLNDAVLQLGTQVGYTGTQMAEALYHPISAGLDLKSALQVVKYAAEEARISGASLDDTTYSLSSVMKAFNLSASQAGPTMASLNAIVGEGDMRFQDFNASIKNWAPTAAQMGISINSMGAGLAYLTDRGNSAEVASTRLTMGLAMMTTPSAKATAMLKGLGLASTDVSASSAAMQTAMQKAGITQNQLALDLKKPDGLYVALKDLKDHLVAADVSGTEADSVLSKIFGGGRSDKAIMSLMQNLDGLKQKYDAIGHDSSMSHFQSAWEKTQQTFNARLKDTEAALVNLGIKLGTMLLPYVEKFLGWVRVGIDWLMQHKGAVLALAGALGTTLVAAIVGVGVAFFASFGWAEAIAAAVMAVGAAVVYAYNHFKIFHTIVNAVGSFIAGAFTLAWRAAATLIHWFATNVLPLLRAAIQAVFAWFERHKQIFITAWDALVKGVHRLVKWFDQNVLTWVRARIAELVTWWHSHSAEIKQAWDRVFKFLHVVAKVWWDGHLKPMLVAVAAFWKVTWGVIKDVLKIVWGAIGNVITIAMHTIMGVIAVILDVISGHWGKAWKDLKKMAKQQFEDAADGLKKLGSGFGNLLYDAGRNIVSGLISGIKSMIGGAGSAISDVVSYISGFLPHSPAKWGPLSGSGSPQLAGARIGGMLADGMRSSLPRVGMASNRLAGAAALAVGGGVGGPNGSLAGLAVSGSGAVGGGAPAVVYNVTVQGSVIRERELYELLQRQALRYGRRNPTTGLTYH